ncbi:MAG: ABC transporter permease [Silvibacterium sp.]
MSWLTRVFHRRDLYRDLAEEVREHLEEKTEQFIREGMSREEAEHAARRAFGNSAVIEQHGREAWQWLRLESLIADARFALRQLRMSPGFAVTAIFTLALGIGANTAIFSIVDAVLLRPLPYKNPDRLVVVWQTDAAHRGTGAWFDTYREFDEWQRTSKSFEQLTALSWATGGKTLLLHGKPVDMLAIPTSANFFSMLGIAPQIGRTFEAGDLHNKCTLVLSHHFWQTKLGATRNIYDEKLSIDQSPCVVVGVMPRDFSFYPTQTDGWMLITPESQFVKKPWETMTGVFGRIRPGVSRAAAQAELNAIEKRILPESPYLGVLGAAEPDVLDMQSEFTWLAASNLRIALWTLLAAVALVLLIACVNIANLLLGRSMERAREMAIRAALGSGRRRLVRTMFTESLLLAMLGAGAGIALAEALLQWFVRAHPVEMPPSNTLNLNWQVLLFTAALAAGSSIFFGLLPAFRGSRVDLNTILSSGDRGVGATASAHRISRTLVAAQVALSLMLLAAAGLLIESLWRLAATPVGYRTDNLLTAWVNLTDQYRSLDAKNEFYTRFAEKISALPSVQTVMGGSSYFPKSENLFSIQGKAARPGPQPSVQEQEISANFLRTMQIPLLRGRDFATSDRSNTQPVAIVNEALAEKYFPHEDPIGRAIKLGRTDDPYHKWITIVGLAANVKTTTVFQEMGYVVAPAVYRPLTQDPPADLAVIVATQDEPLRLAGAVQQQLWDIDPNLVLAGVDTMAHKQSAVLSQPRFRSVLFGGFALLALMLAVIGIYGLLAQAVIRQRRSIGIRMALGASRACVMRGVLEEALCAVMVGLVLGMTGAILTVRALTSMLYGVRPESTAVFSLSAGILLLAALFAGWLPAWRAASIDPIQTLRIE